MTWKTELSKDLTALRVLCSGPLSSDELMMLTIEVSFLAQQHGCGKILVDLSKVNPSFPVSELCALLDSYADYQLPQTTRTGIVLGSINTPQDLAPVLATAKTYGYTMDMLTHEQSKAWLLEKG